MGKLKAIKVVTPRIVQSGESGRGWLWLVFLAVLAAWTWQVFEFGRQHGGIDRVRLTESDGHLRDRITELEQERDLLREQAAQFERSGQIDRAAVVDVQGEVKSLQDERAALKREVAFLKSLVSGGGKLALDDFRLTEVEDDTYRFEVTLSKKTEDDATVEGQVVLRVRGVQGDVERTLDMQSVTDGRRSNIGIRFKNFQKLRTDIIVPEGFRPIAVEVTVEPEGKTFKPFEQIYDWKVTDT
ncbi:MAG: hypothetical protein H6959_03825 [Chromatiaceae bacterium]|nr:hypothetical protein [Chromatiaceae bacterium]MCP5422019.1 hypothetical protein [Chromatiaceae bacterium]